MIYRPLAIVALLASGTPAVFAAATADDELTRETIARTYHETRIVLDPHSAVGVAAARRVAVSFLRTCGHISSV